MFYSYAEKQGDGFFGTWQLRQVAFDTMRRYLYYSEPTTCDFPLRQHLTHGAVGSTSSLRDASDEVGSPVSPGDGGASPGFGASATSLSTGAPPSRGASSTVVGEGAHPGGVSEVCFSPSRLQWKRKVKVTAVVPVATRMPAVPRGGGNERDLYQLEVKGELRQMVTGETPPAGPLLCPAAGLSSIERDRCCAANDAYIRDPFFLKELFDSLRDQFDEIAKERVRAATAAADREQRDASDSYNNQWEDVSAAGMQTLTSPRRRNGEAADPAASPSSVIPTRVLLRCRDEREFRRLWYVLQTVLGYDKLIVRPYRGLPPYDPRNGVAFAHVPMTVWRTFHSLDKAVFYTFIRGNFHALETGKSGRSPLADDSSSAAAAVTSTSNLSRGAANMTTVFPMLTKVLEGAYLCITHDSILCMRETGNIPRWLRLAEVREFHWDVSAKDKTGTCPNPFCVFASDGPVPDLFFEPLPPVFGASAIAGYDPIVDVRRIARVIHDTCFASFSARRVIRLQEAKDESMTAYVARTVREGRRPPTLQSGDTPHNSTLSCPLPKEQLAVVWQQVQSELLVRGNMANRAAIPIYRTNAREMDLSEDQLSTVERELDDVRERRDDVVGMPLARAQQLEPTRRAADATGRHGRGRSGRHRHRDEDAGGSATANTHGRVGPQTVEQQPSATHAQVVPLTMELLQTPQLQGRFASTANRANGEGHEEDGGKGGGRHTGEADSTSGSPTASTVQTSEYSSYLVPGARYLSPEEWHSTANAAAAPVFPQSTATPKSAHKSINKAAGTLGPGTVTEVAGQEVGSPHETQQSSASSGAASVVATAGEGRAHNHPLSPTTASNGRSLGRYAEERTINEIVGHSMAAMDGSHADLMELD